MMSSKPANRKQNGKTKPGPFNTEAFLNSAGVAKTIRDFSRKDVKISVVSKTGKEAVVGMLGQGDFIGEGDWQGSQSE